MRLIKLGVGTKKSWKMLLQSLMFLVLLVDVKAHLKLNVPRVRLPYFDNLSVNFTLNVDNPGQGCYHWSVSRSDVITISSGDSDSDQYQDGVKCSSRAIISTVPRVSPCCPASAIVYAEDSNTHEMVRCDVIIDRINSISIVTTTKELHLEEAPSKFHIRGYGSKNNEFSTLDGIPIRWLLETAKETSSTTDPQSIMRFLPFSESTYQAPLGVAILEANRQQGSTVLIEGIKTGSAVVVARLMDPLYKSVEARVRIVVVANVNVEPSEAYIVPGTVVPLKLKQLKHGKLSYISLPSSTYEFEVSNSTVASYDTSKSLITALEYGETTIVVKDKYCMEEMEEEHPEALTAYIHVRQPKFLSLTVFPNRNWALVINRQYEIQVDLFDSDNQKILITDNIMVETQFDANAFRVEESSNNGTYYVGVPIKQGTYPVSASLKYTLRDGKQVKPITPVKIKTEMEIYQNVALNPKETVLPWDPVVQSRYDLRWNPSGGTGHFVWSSTNTSVLTVTQTGTGRTESLGFANVTAASSVNSNIKGQAKVYILPPTSMEIVDHIVEAEVGIPIQVPLAFYTIRPDDITKALRPFSSCGTLPLSVVVEDPNFSHDTKTHYPHLKPACTVLPIVGNTLGSSLVTVTYKIADKVFTDSVTVSTFKSLDVVEPASHITVLAVGSSKQIAFEGGPRPLLEKHAGFFKRLDVGNTTVASGKEIRKKENSRDDLYVYEVLCTEIGETDVAFQIGNNKTSESSKPVIRVAVVTVICAEPAQMYFKVETTIRTKCPNDASSAQVVRVSIPNYETTLVSVTVKDNKGRKFDNITSLNINWRANKDDLLGFETTDYVVTETIQGNGFTLAGKSYQTLHPKKKSGNVEVTAEILGYRNDVLTARKIYKHHAFKAVEDTEGYSETQHSMDLTLVADLSVHPSPINVFNHPSVKAVVHVKEGSGYFELDTLGSQIIALKYHQQNRTIEILPLEEGSTRIFVRDLCISTKPAAEIIVNVNGVGHIETEVVDKIQVHTETDLTVRVLDHSGSLLSPELLSLIKLRLLPMNSEAIELVPIENAKTSKSSELVSIEDAKSSELKYKLKGRNVGYSTITFVADGVGALGQMARSTPKTVNVFPPLSLRPRNVTMLVGSVYQIMAVGGPQPDALTEFTWDKEKVIHVNQNGLIIAHQLGTTNILGKSVERPPSKNVFSEDHISVTVVPLNGIRIHSPVNRIQSDNEVSLWAVGVGQGIEPFILLGGQTPLLTFEWSVTNRETGEILHVFQKNGYIPSNPDQIGVRFRAKQPGHVTVRLVAKFIYDLERKPFVDETEIEVFSPFTVLVNAKSNARLASSRSMYDLDQEQVYEELRLLKVSHSCRPILMTPNSELSLKTNRDLSGSVTYSVQLSRPPVCNERSESCKNMRMSSDPPVVTVDSSGNVKAYETTGQTVILVSVQEDFGIVQSLSVTIEVKPVSFMMANPELPLNFASSDKPSLPRGVVFPFYITYHDNVGRIFDATNSVPKVRPNRFDIVQVNSGAENNSFVVQTLSEGRSCLKVYDDAHPHLSEYLVISVGEAIDPQLPFDALFVGDVVCFSCAIKSNDLVSGKWVAEPKNLIQLDEITGLGICRFPGKVHIEYNIPGVGAVTSIDVTVMDVSHLSFAPSTIPATITDGDPTAIYDVVVNIGDKHSSLVGNRCSKSIVPENIEAPFTCHIAFDNKEVATASMLKSVLTVKPVFLFEKRRYACRIEPKSEPTKMFFSSMLETNVQLFAKVDAIPKKTRGFDANLQQLIQTDPIVLKFNPSIYVKTPLLQMTTKDTSAKLILTGLSRILDEVELKVSTEDGGNHITIGDYTVESPFLHHSIQTFENTHIANQEKSETRVYPVSLLYQYWLSGLNADQSLAITIISKSTKQTITVPVKIKFVSKLSDIGENSQGVMNFMAINSSLLISTFVALILIYYTCFRTSRTNNLGFTDSTLFIPNGSQSSTYTPTSLRTSANSSPHSHGAYTSLSKSPLNSSPINAYGDVAASPSGYRLYSTSNNDSGYKRSPRASH